MSMKNILLNSYLSIINCRTFSKLIIQTLLKQLIIKKIGFVTKYQNFRTDKYIKMKLKKDSEYNSYQCPLKNVKINLKMTIHAVVITYSKDAYIS